MNKIVQNCLKVIPNKRLTILVKQNWKNMNLQSRKIEFVKAFLQLEDEESISILEPLLKSENNGDFSPMTLEELNQRISLSEADFIAGRYKSHEELKDALMPE